MVTAIIVASGKSERMGVGTDKCFLSLGSRPVVVWSLLAFEQCADIDQIVLVVKKEQMNAIRSAANMFGISKLSKIVPGGLRRQDSVKAGLDVMDPDTRVVCVHDGARPCVKPALISETVKAAKRYGSGVCASRVTDTIKQVTKSMLVDCTIDRDTLWAVQTPQTFKADLLVKAYKALDGQKAVVTDEAGAVELLGESVRLVDWPYPNIKITVPEDLSLAAAVLQIT